MNSLSTKIHYLLLFISLFAIISCNDDEIVYPEGGYPYLKNVASSDTNFYFLPIRHLIPKKDSFIVLDQKYCYDAFNEPNLSINAPKADIFRFFYGCSFCGKYAFITLTKNNIILKTNKTGVPYLLDSIELLSPTEKEHYYLFDRHYPLQTATFKEWKKKYVDSSIKIYPELLDPSYFLRLKKKMSISYHIPFTFSTKVIPISHQKFKYFVTLINKSEFWQRPYDTAFCRGAVMDGDYFYLEAATKKKYHLVNSNECLDMEADSKFKKVTEELLNFIHFDLEAFYKENFPK